MTSMMIIATRMIMGTAIITITVAKRSTVILRLTTTLETCIQRSRRNGCLLVRRRAAGHDYAVFVRRIPGNSKDYCPGRYAKWASWDNPHPGQSYDHFALNLNTMTACLLNLEDVTYAWPDADEAAIRHLDLTITAGEKVFLGGPSGSGKTTLLNLIGGLIAPQGGRIRFADSESIRSDSQRGTSFVRTISASFFNSLIWFPISILSTTFCYRYGFLHAAARRCPLPEVAE